MRPQRRHPAVADSWVSAPAVQRITGIRLIDMLT
jgi:hypothetical protein